MDPIYEVWSKGNQVRIFKRYKMRGMNAMERLYSDITELGETSFKKAVEQYDIDNKDIISSDPRQVTGLQYWTSIAVQKPHRYKDLFTMDLNRNDLLQALNLFRVARIQACYELDGECRALPFGAIISNV